MIFERGGVEEGGLKTRHALRLCCLIVSGHLLLLLLLLLRLGLRLMAHGRWRALRATTISRRAVVRLRLLLLRGLLPGGLRAALRTQVEWRHAQGYQARMLLHLQ